MISNISSTIYIIVPIYNESKNAPSLLDSMQKLTNIYQDKYKIAFVVVDDCSTDDSVAVFQNETSLKYFNLLKHSKNMGPGAAFATAFEFICPMLNSQDYVVTMEGDNTSNINLFDTMLKRSLEGYEVVLASPYMYGGNVLNTSTVRVFLSSIANIFAKEMLGIHGILTVSSFYRLYRASAIKKLYNYYGNKIITRNGFECAIEILLKLIYVNTTITEIPMVLDTGKRYGKSKMKILKTIVGYFALFFLKGGWKRQVSAYCKKG